MKVLHICRDFVGSKVHSELYKHLDKLGVEQIVYCAYRDKHKDNVGNNFFESEKTKIFYRPILKLYHRILFFRKTRKTVKDIEKVIDLSSIDLIHATTVFTDGAVARSISKRYNIPYVVAVRNTDYNDFIMHAPHLWMVHRDVLLNAKKVFFITSRLKTKFLNHFTLRNLRNIINQKSAIQSNGVDDYWLKNINLNKRFSHSILYVGNFEPIKNVRRLISAVVRMKSKYPDLCLNIIGGGGWDNGRVMRMINKYKDTVIYHGKIYDKAKLREYYNNSSIFAMPSIHETFGLVYIEALSQGMRVLCSRNEGIDGVFEDIIGEFVNPYDVQDIKASLEKLLENRHAYNLPCKEEFHKFSWSDIAIRYFNEYKLILEKTTLHEDRTFNAVL